MEDLFNNVLISVICIIHIIIFILILSIPILSNSNYFLFFYIMTVPFIELHWLANNNTCCLTEIEKKIRGIDDEESFINRILSPIYTFPNNNQTYSDISYIAINILIAIAISKMINKIQTGEVSCFCDLYYV